MINKKIQDLWPLNSNDELEFYVNKLKNKEDFNNVKLPFIKNELNFNSKYNLLKEENGVLLFKLIESNKIGN